MSAPTAAPAPRRTTTSWGTVAALLLTAVAMTGVFWPTLWTGGGLVGGDIYYYFMPQKAFYADSLARGELPLWNNLVGNGYPQLAESQTGVFYPPYLVLYRFCDLGTAFNLTILGHYVLAFVAAWLYLRRLGLRPLSASFGALVYTYSWFPPRVSLEWAIVGGSWLPLALWCAESFLQTGRRRFLLVLPLVLTLQLLAGHFLLAFLTQLCLAVTVPVRLWWSERLANEPAASRFRRGGWVFGMIALAFVLAAAQLVPTWELKQASQRQTVTAEHDPGYGYIPLAYLAQVIQPWKWYAGDQMVQSVADPAKPRTNWVEAHLYFGLLPLVLAGVGLFDRRSTVPGPVRGLWLAMIVGAVSYATGWLLPVTNHLPGFSFFEGPGRYGVIATLGVALLAGAGFAVVERRLPGLACLGWIVVAFGATGADLWWVSQRVTHAFPVEQAPVGWRDRSPIRQFLAERETPTRMLNEGKNLPSLVGAGTYPVYLGLGPAAYFDPDLAMPQPLPFRETLPTADQLDWLERNGVTHILSLTQIPQGGWPVKQIWFGADPCLNVPLARSSSHGFYLYELERTRGRVSWLTPGSNPAPRLVRYEPQLAEIVVDAVEPGTVVLTDLAYPGWDVSVDGQASENLLVERIFRGVAVPSGVHRIRWTYQSRSVYLGISISLMGCVVWGTLARKWWNEPGESTVTL
ncbi:MAG: hypothetical protein ACK5TO_11175 [Planctomycetaceae bacterium]